MRDFWPIRRWYDPYATSPVNREIAWGARVLHWGPRDWRDLWRALRDTGVPAWVRLWVWAVVLGHIVRLRRCPALWDEGGL